MLNGLLEGREEISLIYCHIIYTLSESSNILRGLVVDPPIHLLEDQSSRLENGNSPGWGICNHLTVKFKVLSGRLDHGEVEILGLFLVRPPTPTQHVPPTALLLCCKD